MIRSCLLVIGLAIGAMIANSGCQSCSSCHDYDSPVANCHCGHCPQCCNGGCDSGCTTCGCSSCVGGECTNAGYDSDGFDESGPALEGTPAEGTPVEGQLPTPKDIGLPAEAR
jgi:hypothetical protein